MKTVNEYRRGDHFNITGVILRYLVEVSKFVEAMEDNPHLVAVVPAAEGKPEDRWDLFTCRVCFGTKAIYDLLIEASTHKPCIVIDRVLISGYPILMK